MTLVRHTLAIVLSVLFMAPAVRAQQHVIDRAALDQAVQQRVARDRADREAIVALLRRADVRDVAGKAGLSLERAETAVAALQGDDLHQIASQARQVQSDLAGGASTVTISTTTIIIILLVVILIVVIAD